MLLAALINILGHDKRGDRPTEVLLIIIILIIIII